MDRFDFSVADGVVVIDTESVSLGDPPGEESIDEPVRGRLCLDEGAH